MASLAPLELIARFPGKSLKDLLLSYMLDRKDIEYLVRKVRRGKALPADIEHKLITSVQLNVLSAQDLALPLDIKAYREAVLLTPADRLDEWVHDVQLLVERARSELSYARVTQLLYVLMHAFFRKGSIQHAYMTARSMEDAADKAGAALPAIWQVLPRVNRCSFWWQLIASRQNGTAAEKCEFIEMLREGCAASRAAADANRFWIRVRRDQIEYMALLMHYGQDMSARELDEAIWQVVRAYKNHQVNYPIRLLNDELEPAALALVQQRPVYVSLVAAAGGSVDTSIARVTDKLLADMKAKVSDL